MCHLATLACAGDIASMVLVALRWCQRLRGFATIAGCGRCCVGRFPLPGRPAGHIRRQTTAAKPESADQNPHGHGPLRPSSRQAGVQADDTVGAPDVGLARGNPGGACWSAQKDASASWLRSMAVLPGWNERQDRSRVGRRRRPKNLEQPHRERPSISKATCGYREGIP
jgi:hypothetical protein